MSSTTRLALAGKAVLFVTGVGIVINQTGFPWLLEQPPGGPSIPSLLTGALFCNGPVVLQALAIRFGSSSSQPGASQQPSPPASPSAPSSDV